MKIGLLFGMFASCTLMACQSVPSTPAQQIDVTKSLGLKQCEGDDPKVRLQQLKEQLQQAGIEVYNEALGHDGLVHITVCGASTGQTAIFTISATQLGAAQGLGYQLTPAP